VRVPDGERVVEVLTAGARVVNGRWLECPARAREAEFRVVSEEGLRSAVPGGGTGPAAPPESGRGMR
jgi:hypothetical protein